MIHYAVSDGLCVLRLDASPLNTITLEMLDELGRLLRRAIEAPDVRAVIIAGREDHFSAGADIRLFQAIASREDALQLSRRFQEAFQEIEDSSKPVVAAVAGRVLGGALELALACHYRVAAEGSRFAMPEVNLGILPGAGGTQRLPRLVGLETALRMLLRAESLDAEEALRLGLVDAVAPAKRLIGRACEIVRGGGEGDKSNLPELLVNAGRDRGHIHPQRPGRLDSSPALAEAAQLAEAARPELLAPRKIVEVVRTGLEVSFEAGLQAEQQALADCLLSPAAQNKVYLFFATRNAAKLPELDEAEEKGMRPISAVAGQTDLNASRRKWDASPVTRAAVVGLGTMGTGIAQALASAGMEVVALDQDPSAAARGIERIRASLRRRVADGKLSPAQADATLARLRAAEGWNDLAGSDLVIESVFEDLAAKQAVFARLAEVCRPDATLATNTSTLTLERLAEGLPDPRRLAGLHFFNPAHVMPLVEVIRRDDTPPATIATLVALVKRLRKTPVVVRSREGFVVNRLFIPYVQEAFWLVEEGAPPEAVDAAMRAFGFPMGPLELIDMAGLDILVDAQAVLAQAFPWHGPLSQVVLSLVERGMKGQKSGAGVYRYQPGERTPLPNPATAEAVGQVSNLPVGRLANRSDGRLETCPTVGQTANPSHGVAQEALTERLVLRMVGEAFRVLDEHVARCQGDADAASVLGMGFPDFRGGVMKYAADLGHRRVRERLAALARVYGERFALT